MLFWISFRGQPGLIRAVEKFDYTKGYKFDICNVVDPTGDHLCDGGSGQDDPNPCSHGGGHQQAAQRQMLQDLGREPTPKNWPGTGMTPEKVVEVQK